MSVKPFIRRCKVCRHTERETIEQLLVLGTSLRSLEQRFGVNKTSLCRHKKHLSAEILDVAAGLHELRRESLLKMLVRLGLVAEQLMCDAMAAGEPRDVIAAINAATRAIATLLQFLPERDSPQSEIVIDLFDAEPTEWQDPIRLGGNGDR